MLFEANKNRGYQRSDPHHDALQTSGTVDGDARRAAVAGAACAAQRQPVERHLQRQAGGAAAGPKLRQGQLQRGAARHGEVHLRVAAGSQQPAGHGIGVRQVLSGVETC